MVADLRTGKESIYIKAIEEILYIVVFEVAYLSSNKAACCLVCKECEHILTPLRRTRTLVPAIACTLAPMK